jgi:hypothetical protein
MATPETPVETQHSYIYFECCLISLFPKEISSILNYGVYKLALTFEGTDYQILTYAINLHFDKKLPRYLSASIDSAGITERPVKDYEFKAAYCTLDYSLTAADIQSATFAAECKPYYQLYKALTFLKLSGAYEPVFKAYQRIKLIVDTHEATHGNDAMVSVKTDKLIEFRDENNSYKDFELLKGFMAIKSLQGKKDFIQTTKAMIIARMIGAKSDSVAKCLLKDKSISKLYNKFNGRYYFDNLISQLLHRGFIKSKISGNRCLYISTSLDGALLIPAIANHVESKQRKNIVAKQKEQENSFKNQLNNILYNK